MNTRKGMRYKLILISFPRSVCKSYLSNKIKKKEMRELVHWEDNTLVLGMDILVWSTDKFMTPHLEGYIHAILEQDILSNYLQHKRKETLTDNRCRLCKSNTEHIKQITANYERMSSRYYLTMGHDVVVRTVWNRTTKIKTLTDEVNHIKTKWWKEYWKNFKIKATTKLVIDHCAVGS